MRNRGEHRLWGRDGRPAIALVLAVAALAGCTGTQGPRAGPVTFDTATVWIHSASDSAAVRVEIAETQAQQEKGLGGRSGLDEDAGMLFVFDAARDAEEGFWMWNTSFPLDIAFADRDGVILEIRSMEPCESLDPDDCPAYLAGVEHWYALEVSRGWFDGQGIRPGDRISVDRLAGDDSEGPGI